MIKKIILMLTFSNLIYNCQCQEFEPNFLADDFLLYKGVLFKLQDDPASNFTYTFYSELKYCESSYDNPPVLYPDSKYKFNTEKDSLSNRIFRVADIVDKTGVSITKPILLEKPIFILEDINSKQKIYYKYDTRYEHNFPFNTSKILLDENTVCPEIEKQDDDFTSEIKFNTPYPDNKSQALIVLYKHIKNGKPVYYLSLRTYGGTAVVDGIGATVLFSDGTKWSKPIKIGVEAESDGYEYSAFIPLNQTDLALLSSKKIKKYRLYIFDKDVNTYQANKIKLYANCLKKVK
jgi:hypothetical protein